VVLLSTFSAAKHQSITWYLGNDGQSTESRVGYLGNDGQSTESRVGAVNGKSCWLLR
jgi:hypothetical protein